MNTPPREGKLAGWQARYLATEVGKLERQDLETNATRAAAREFARSFVASGVTVAVLELPTIASALNIGINLYPRDCALSGKRLCVP